MPNSSGMNVQCWCDVKVIADLAFLLKEKGFNARGKTSKLLNKILEGVQENSCSYHFPSIEMALEYLNSEGYSLAQLDPNDKRNGLANDLVLEGINFDKGKYELNKPEDKDRVDELTKILEGE